jgi:predicted anti-sigma-YlaC factor YlaD
MPSLHPLRDQLVQQAQALGRATGPALGLQLDGEHVHAPLLVARESLKFCTSHRSSHSRSKTNAIMKGTSASPMGGPVGDRPFSSIRWKAYRKRLSSWWR